MNINDTYQYWCERCGVEESGELRKLAADRAALEDAFVHNLRFGTGGLRGKVGAGPNKLNVWTVGKATQGLADYLNRSVGSPSAVIAHDSRRGGEEFARRAAEVFAANGVRAFVFDGVASTPELSFAVRDLECSAGVCITASHNPAEYNGYKVYGQDGCQITTEAAREIQRAIDAVDVFDGVRWLPWDEGAARDFIVAVDDRIRRRYIDAVAGEREGIDCSALSVAYTPLNGTGLKPVRTVLARMGVGRVGVVPEQAAPDGEFPTCPKPNPEVPEAMRLVTELAAGERCDLALATDPDADRVGVAVTHAGNWRLLTGNEVGELLMDWLLSRTVGRVEDVTRLVCATTVVSAPRADAIARLYGCQLRRTLTGFKFIGEQIRLLEEAGEADRFLFGLEESCGYLKGSYVRDKDGVEALALVCEMVADYKARGMDLVDALEELGRRVGFQAGRQVVRAFEGADGSDRMTALMSSLRVKPPASLAGHSVEHVIDYARGASMPVVNPLSDEPAQSLPPTDMVEWRLDGEARVLVRPSGTEPKLKAYCFAGGPTDLEARAAVDMLADAVMELLDASEGTLEG